MTSLRHSRQSRLSEVGVAGQGRIARAALVVPLEGFAAEVAVRYLAGAGAGTLRVREASLASVALAVDPAVKVEVDARIQVLNGVDGVLRHEASRELARGAVAALQALRAVVEGETP